MSGFVKLCRAFANPVTFPIQVDDLARWIISNGFQQGISFYPVDINEDYLYGFIEQYAPIPRPYVEYEIHSRIYYCRNTSECWQRFICCKELTHILDGVDYRTNTSTDIIDLITQITALNTPDAQPTISTQTLTDMGGAGKALILLAPLATVNALKDSYRGKTKSKYDIALFLKIPEVFIDFIFTDKYAQMYTSTVVSLAEAAE